jgi:hypothetical protein
MRYSILHTPTGEILYETDTDSKKEVETYEE